MEQTCDHIALKSGQKRVESLFTLRAVGHFCDQLGTLWVAASELTVR
jgi:hypothetical protein